MGCDIHWYSETRKDGKWFCDQADSFNDNCDGEGYPEMGYFPHSDRDYWFFGLLAEVRTDWPMSFQPKGFPEDASQEVQKLYQQWDSDGYSHSWLTRAELKAKLAEMGSARAAALIVPVQRDVQEGLTHLVQRLEQTITALSADVPDTDQRIVFWFDN